MSRRLWIAPSLLSADMARLAYSIERVAAEADIIHCDVMDGHFVPNLTFGPPIIKAIKRASQGVPLDVHLMIESPVNWIKRFLDAGLSSGDYLTFHIEADADPRPGLVQIREAGVGAGLSVKPKTPFETLIPYKDMLDQILVMTVEPGFGGQAFMGECLTKVVEARKLLGPGKVVAVDGGIDPITAPRAFLAGADLLVAGNAVYGKPRPLAAIRRIREACRAVEER